MSEFKLIYSFKIKKKTIEIIHHQGHDDDSDLHYWFYIDGCKSDVCFPRSIKNDGTSLYKLDKMKMYKLRNKICYGASKYNKKLIRNYFKKFKNKYPELFI